MESPPARRRLARRTVRYPISTALLQCRMEIRKAALDDAAVACAVLRRSIAELCHADHRDDPVFINRWLENKTPENVSAWIADPDNCVYVAVENGVVFSVGAVTRSGVILLNYVSPDARFKGVSKAMLKQLEKTAAERGNRRCTLSSTVTARWFYLSAGYQVQAPAPKTSASGIPMAKELSRSTREQS